MKKIYFLLLMLGLFLSANVNAQFAVTTNGGSGLAGTYPNLATAITALNGASITSPVIITCPTGTETSPAGGYSVTATGTAVNTIIIQGNGAANSVITSPTPAGTVGNLNDAIFKIIGGDYITIQGFAMNENGANTTTAAATNNMLEWGVALLYASTTNGAQNCIILNNSITLNRSYQNTFGLYSNSTHSATVVTTSASATTTAGGNSGMKVYGNTISNVNQGIVVVGPTAVADMNTGIDIGGAGGAQANTISNYGTTSAFSSYANVSGTLNGILVRNSLGFNISYNNITSSLGASGVNAGTLNGIQIPAASTTAGATTITSNINNNTLALTSHVLAGAINGINLPSGYGTLNTTMNINNNNFTTLNHTIAAATGAIIVILHTGTGTNGPLNVNINSNTFTNISSSSTGSFTFISNSYTAPTSATKNSNGNSIVTGFTKTGAGGTVLLYTDNGSSPAGVIENNNNNNFSNITLTGATIITGYRNTDGGSPTKTVTGNTFSNWVCGTNAATALAVSFAASATVSGNTVSNITGGGAITGIESSSGTQTFTGNTVHTLTSTGASVVSGLSITGATTQQIVKTKIYNLEANNAFGSVNGILVTAGTTVTLTNNLIGDLRTPAANAANPLNGINITGGTTVNAYYNTVYLNGTSSGALFGSSAISGSSTPALLLQNNIFVNTSGITGAGSAVGYRRSTTTLTSYQAASNNNLFYGTSAIFTDGTNTDITIGAYKTRVAPRDGASASENLIWQSTSGASSDFLKYDLVTPTQAESGGTAIGGITDDFGGTARNVSTPDMGAWELAGTGLDLSGPSISYTILTSAIPSATRAFTAVTITDASGVNGTSGTRPRVYYKKSGDANDATGWKFVEANGATSAFDFTIDYSLLNAGSVTAGDVIQYFVVAQDLVTTPNVGINNGTFTATPTSVNLTGAAYPIGGTINSYAITAAISGTITVPGTYPSLTLVGGAFEAINNATVTGNINLEITGDLTLETGLNALNAFASPYTLKIYPAGAAHTVSGSSATSLIKLNGADRVTIDGSIGGTGTDRSLTIANTSGAASTAAVWISSLGAGLGAADNTLKNCIINGGGNTNTTYAVAVNGTSITGGTSFDNDNNRIQNNEIINAQYAIWVRGNHVTSSETPGLVITENIVGSSNASTYITDYGIYVSGVQGAVISKNTIFNIKSDRAKYGIYLNSYVRASTFSANKIYGFATLTSTTALTTSGIHFNTTTGCIDNQIDNNVVYDILNYGSTGSTIAGIRISGGTNYKVYFNSVRLSGSLGNSSGANTIASLIANCFHISAASTNLDIRNNVFYNDIVGTTPVNYVMNISTTTTFASFNNNCYYSINGTNIASINSTTCANLAAIQALTLTIASGSNNGNSINTNPNFTSATDLSIPASATPTGLESGAATGTGVTVDFTGATRPVAGSNGGGIAPDMGAFEFDGAPLPVCTTPTAQPTLLILTATGQTTVSGSYTAAAPAPSNYLVVRTTSASLAANPVIGTLYTVGANTYFGAGGFVESIGSGLTISSTGLTAGTTYYYWVFSFNNSNCTGGPIYNVTTPLNGSVTTGALFTSIASGNWEDATTWNQGANVPNAASDIAIAAGHTVTVNSTAAVGASLTVAATGVLTVSGNSLNLSGTITNSGTVTANGGTAIITGASTTGITNNSGAIFTVSGGTFTVGGGANNRRFTNNGTLNVSSGILNINGNLNIASGATFNQSGGDINVDGNAANDIANSVASGTSLVLVSSALGTVNGGTMTIVDPPAATTATKSLSYSVSSTSIRWAGHSLILGDGISTDLGGATNGFELDSYVSTGRLVLGNVIVNGGAGTNRYATSSSSTSNGTWIGGTLTINANSELRDGSATIYYLAGNIVNNGTFTNQSATIILADWNTATNVQLANVNAQTISGSGLFRNSTTSPTALFSTLTINNTHVDGVTFAAGLTPSLSSTLTVTAGKVTADALSFNGASTQTVALTAATSIINVGNVTLNNGVTLSGLGMLNVSGVLSFGNVNSKTLTAAGRITLLSTATATARVADITNAGVNTGNVISGNLVVERFITDAGHRAWRLLSGKSVNGTQTIYNAWQEGGAMTAGRGTWITSTNYSGSNGFDATNTNQASIATHIQGGGSGPTWDFTMANTNVTSLSSNQGYMLYVRGDRSHTGGNTTWGSTTLKTTGALNQGNQAAVTVSSTGTGRTLVGNPFASPIDVETILTGNATLDQDMYLWDPTLTGNFGVGGFVVIERNNGGNYFATPVGGSQSPSSDSRYIRSGQAFFLKATGGDANVVITENMKAAGLNPINPIVSGPADQQVYANLMVVNPGNVASLADGIRVRFDGAYNANTNDDILKMGNFAENISSYRESKKLIVERRPMISSRDTIFLRSSNLSVKDYRFTIGTFDFVQANVTAFLQDIWLNTSTAINLNGLETDVNFSVTTDPASANVDRFRIVFAAAGPLPVTITSVKAAQQGTAIAVEWKASNQLNMRQYEVEKSTDGINFYKVNTQNATGVNGSDATYVWLDANPVVGSNFYRIRSIGINGDVKITQVVVVKIGKGSPVITVYPNPVTNRNMGLQFADMDKGIYQLRLINAAGQVVFSRTVNHAGGSAAQSVVLGNAVAKGNYQLEILKPDNSKTSKSVFIAD